MKERTMTPEAPANGLERKLGLFPLTNIVIANMIGAGIFTTSGLLMKDLHHPVVMLGLWLAGGLIALCGALSYGELGAAFPRPAGNTPSSRGSTIPSSASSPAGSRSSSASPRPSPRRPSASRST